MVFDAQSPRFIANLQNIKRVYDLAIDDAFIVSPKTFEFIHFVMKTERDELPRSDCKFRSGDRSMRSSAI